MNDILNKIYMNINKDIHPDDKFKIIIQSFEIFKSDECDILLLNSNGSVLRDGNSKLYENIMNSSVEESLLYIKQFGGDGCPEFYLIIHKENQNSYVQNLGEKIKKNFMLVNCYKEKYDVLINYLDAVQEGISAVDKHGTLIYANNACCDMIGISKEQIMYKKAGAISKGTPRLLEVIIINRL